MTKDAHRFRLSVMMFGQFLILGSWSVTLATYLMNSPVKGGLNFPPSYAAWIYSTVAFGGIIAPIFIGLLADRLFAAQKLMAFLHLFGAFLLMAAAWWCSHQQPVIEAAYRAAASREVIDGSTLIDVERRLNETPDEPPADRRVLKEAFGRVNQSPEIVRILNETFVPLFLLMFVYCFGNITTLILSNVIVFRNVRDPQNSFGKIRLCGTIGWIVAGISLEILWNPNSTSPLFYAGGLSLFFGLFCFTLPSTPPSGGHKSLAEALGLPALSMFRDGSFRVVIGCALIIAVVQQFYGVYTNRFLNELRAPYPAAIQTLGQVSEVICMMFFPLLISRFGLKTTMAIGLAGWVLRNSLFATQSLPVVLLGLSLHGLSYACFVVVASMYVDRKAPLHLRASAQGIFTFISTGVGTLAGNWLSAQVVETQTVGDIVVWSTVWLVPATLAAGAFVAYVALFHETTDAPVR